MAKDEFREEIEDYAKHLYFENKGFRTITKLIEEKFKQKFGHSTIKNWADNKGWRSQKELAQVRGLVKVAKGEPDSAGQQSQQVPLIGEDEIILDKIARDTAKQYKESLEVREIGLGLIRAIGKIKNSDGKLVFNHEFDFRKLTAAVNAFKAGSEDMRKIEALLDRQMFNPKNLSDEELEQIINNA